VHLPALQRLCLHHRTWLGQVRQIDTSSCPDTDHAAHRAARLARRHSPTRVLLAETTARETIKRWLTQDRHPVLTQRWTARLDRLDATRPLTDVDPCDREDLIAAATYSDTITIATTLLSSTITAAEPRPRAEASARLLGSLQLADRPTN
jgi:hypothetical protein